MRKKTIRDIEVSGKKVLVRVDFNVPLDNKTRTIVDDSRVRATLPTIQYLIECGAKVILMSHLGRPKGKAVNELSLTIVAQRLSHILKKPVGMATDCIGPEAEKLVESLKSGDVLLLENLRFHSEEESGANSFAKALAQLGDVFVNDAFGTSHRAHASITGIANYLPAVAGLLMEKEIKTLCSILENPPRPFALLIGGGKVSDKVNMLTNIITNVDMMLIGGGIAVTFLKAQGYEVGLSPIESDKLDIALGLIDKATRNGVRLLLPVDVVISDRINQENKSAIVFINDIQKDKIITDIGPQTINNFCRELSSCKTVFWNGPVGVYEIPQFSSGTRNMVSFLATLRATTIIGGGSTAEIVYEMGLTNMMTFISTGGGASLKYLSGETLDGVAALLDKES
ncbi:phosphoglycerate kinase [Chloroflexota bacterium]